MTQTEFAKAIGMSQTNYSHYEREEQKFNEEQIITICKTFKVSADWLLEIDTNELDANR